MQASILLFLSFILPFYLTTITTHYSYQYMEYVSSSSQASLSSFTVWPFILIARSHPPAFPFTYSPSFPATHTHCPFQSPSSFCSTSPSLTEQYYIFQSVLCMIWEVDEAISRLSPSASPSLSLLALLFNVSIWRKQTFNQTD